MKLLTLTSCALIATVTLVAQTTLPPEFSQHTNEELQWRGLAALYPNKVLTEAPATFTPHSPRDPMVAELTGGVTYLRIYDLTLAMDALAEAGGKRKLVLDLRFLQGDVPEGFTTLIEQSRALNPAIVIVNDRTAGPIEVALANLQASKHILSVGTHTAGQTGLYVPIEGQDGFYILESESLPLSGQSLLGTGLAPDINVDVTLEDDYRAYHLVERGTPVEHVLEMKFISDNPAEEPDDNSEDAAIPADPSLQRALDVIVALQVLGKLPPS